MSDDHLNSPYARTVIAPRGGFGNYRGNFHRNENTRNHGGRGRGFGRWNQEVRNKFIDVSSDGESLVFSRFGAEIFGETSLVDEVLKSLKILGEYSEDSEKKFVNDRSYLSFLLTKYLPDPSKKQKCVDIDLNDPEGEMESYSGNGKLDLENFLTWIVNNISIFKQEIGRKDDKNEGGTFVTLKKVLSNFVAIPYRFGQALKFYATSVNGVIYLMKDYEVYNDKVGMWAHKFEQFMTKEDITKEVVCNEDFRAVLTCSLGPHKLLYSASLDCANPEEFEDDFTDLSAFVHLKCCEGDSNYFRLQSMHWYMDYILSGVPKVLVGQRNEEGTVSQLQLFEVPDMLQMGKDIWNPANCLNFTSKLLSFIKSRVESDPGAVFCIRKEFRRAEVTCTKEPDVPNFLPVWYREDILENDEANEAQKEDSD